MSKSKGNASKPAPKPVSKGDNKASTTNAKSGYRYITPNASKKKGK